MGTFGGSESLRGLAIGIVALGVVVTGLVVGRTFLIPLAIAIILWNLLEAFIGTFANARIGELRVPRTVATLLGIAVVGLGFYLVFSILAGQADAIAAAWPRYIKRMEILASDLTQWLGPERSTKVRQALADVDLTQRVPGLLASAQSFLVNVLLIIAYMGFLLAEGRNFPAKVAAMSRDSNQAQEITSLLAAISTSIRRYIWIKTIVSVATAVTCYLVLRWIGIDFAETWAILIFILNFIPNIGSTIAVAFPALIALVQFDTLTPFITLVVALTALQILIGSVLEPVLMGGTLNMSPLAIIVGLAFWGTIWGIVGMFLSVPIMVLALIVFAHVPGLRWIAVLLSADGKIEG